LMPDQETRAHRWWQINHKQATAGSCSTSRARECMPWHAFLLVKQCRAAPTGAKQSKAGPKESTAGSMTIGANQHDQKKEAKVTNSH